MCALGRVTFGTEKTHKNRNAFRNIEKHKKLRKCALSSAEALILHPPERVSNMHGGSVSPEAPFNVQFRERLLEKEAAMDQYPWLERGRCIKKIE